MIEIVFDDEGTLIPLVLDAVPEEIHRAAATATEIEVERGVSIADHVRPERRQLILSVVVSDTPIAPTSDLDGEVRAIDIEVPEASGAPSKAQIYQPASTPTRIQDSWRVILDARDRALLATITTRLETYANQALIEAQVTRTAQDGTWLRAQLTFVEIRTVATEFVDDPTPARARNRRRADRGSQSTNEADPQLQSVARRLQTEGVGGFLGGLF